MKQKEKVIQIFEIILLFVGFILLFSWQVRVGLIRYFDVDEFTYFHWVSQFTDGLKPYVDYFMFFPPLFLFFFAPVFWIFGKSVTVFIAGRVLAISIAALLFLVVSSLFSVLRQKRYALLVAVFAAFLPVPFDKFFEIRPDNLATLFAISGVLFHVVFLTKKRTKKIAIISGAFYAASLLVFPKAISFVAVAGVVWIFDFITVGKKIEEQRKLLAASKNNLYKTSKEDAAQRAVTLNTYEGYLETSPLHFLVGGGVVVGCVGLYLLALGNLGQVAYSLIKLPFEANKYSIYIMEAHLYFFPNSAAYGEEGIHRGLLLNHAIWIVGVLMGTYRLFTAGITAEGNKRKMLAEILVSGVFLFNAVLYVSYYPMKHPQYLIPIALFVAFYAVDGVSVVLTRLSSVFPFLSLIVLGVILLVLIPVSAIVNTQKIAWSNTTQLKQYVLLQQMIPKNSEVFDIEGRMIAWKQPYFICCLSFGEWIHNVTKRPPELRTVLEQKKVPFIFQGDSRRIYNLSMADRVYIQNNYEQVEGWGDTIWVRK